MPYTELSAPVADAVKELAALQKRQFTIISDWNAKPDYARMLGEIHGKVDILLITLKLDSLAATDADD